ncbi:MAG: alpha/beta fold hydrolase [Ginsengibacter sp.]
MNYSNINEGKKSPFRGLGRWVKIILFFYVVIGIALYFLQVKILLHPVAYPQDYAYNFKTSFKEVNIPINHHENLNVVQFFPKDSTRKGVVLYFHGNKMNISHYAMFADNFTKFGYEVWMPDYPGFGKTTGELTEKKLYDEAMLVYKLANLKFKADSIIIYGKSFGTGIASQLASVKGSRRLILETPYYSIPALFSYYAPIYPTSYMSKFKLPINEYLQDVTAPVTIFHGTDDEIIPYSVSEKLKSILKPGDEFITLERGKHNNLNDFTLFHHKLDSLLR